MKFGLLRLLITLVCGFDCIHAQFYCADQIQRCAVAIEEYEKDIMQIKDAAFQQCFKRPACHEERIAYNRCFRESLRAVRAPFNGDLETYDNFSEAANRYRATVDSCFLRNPLMAMNSAHDQYYIDVDAIYAKIVYSTEMTDRLWGLSEGTQSALDSGVACMERESALRIFGSGIGRLVGSLDPKLNNLASSCTVEDYEVMCYRNALETSQDFQQLIAQRDYIMRQCIQQVRTRTICQRTDSGTLRGCLCQARDNFDKQIVQAMLSCVSRESPPLPARGQPIQSPENYPRRAPTRSEGLTTGLSADAASIFGIKDTLNGQNREATEIRNGEIINGQCLCSCKVEKSEAEVGQQRNQRYYQAPDEFYADRRSQKTQKKDEEDYPFIYGQEDTKPTSFPVLKERISIQFPH